MYLVIDQGNTHVKLAIFEQNDLIDYQIQPKINDQIMEAFIGMKVISKGIFSSVKKEKDAQLLKKYNLISFSSVTPLPLTINYETPKTLGLDRVAAIVGAQQKYPNTNVLVIDMGTCITYDFIDRQGVYWGGSIAPGLQMRLKAMHHFTDQLPLVPFDKKPLTLTGNSTEKAIQSGVYYGIKGEVNGFIQQYLQEHDDLQIIITGGDAHLFDIAPKNRIFADEFIVLRGLNEILKYNDQK